MTDDQYKKIKQDFDKLQTQSKLMNLKMVNIGFLGLLYFLYAIVFTFVYSEIVFFEGKGTYAPPEHTVEETAPVDTGGSAKEDQASKPGTYIFVPDGVKGPIFAIYYAAMAFLYLRLSVMVCKITSRVELRSLFKSWLTWRLIAYILFLNVGLVGFAYFFDMIPGSYVLSWAITAITFLYLVFFTVSLVIKHFGGDD